MVNKKKDITITIPKKIVIIFTAVALTLITFVGSIIYISHIEHDFLENEDDFNFVFITYDVTRLNFTLRYVISVNPDNPSSEGIDVSYGCRKDVDVLDPVCFEEIYTYSGYYGSGLDKDFEEIKRLLDSIDIEKFNLENRKDFFNYMAGGYRYFMYYEGKYYDFPSVELTNDPDDLDYEPDDEERFDTIRAVAKILEKYFLWY